MIRQIRKRNGLLQPFDKEHIINSIWKAVEAVGGSDKEKARATADAVIRELDVLYDQKIIPDVELIQNTVEKLLIKEGHDEVAKAYILYRKSREDVRDVKGLFHSVDLIDDYISESDWAVKENSNMGFSLQGLNNYIATKVVAKYWNKKIYPKQIREVHENGDLHIHDLGTLGAYCVGWDLKDILLKGFTGVPGKVASKPAKHFRTALGQMVNFFYTLQGETAGAQAFSNVDTLLAPFIRNDNLTYKEIKQAMQEFVFNLAVPTRVGFQTPFTNITLDLEVPKHMADEYVVIGGEYTATTYKEYGEEMKLFNKAFCECMVEGDANGRVFTFPIPTYNITEEFNWDNPEYELIWDMTAKYGIPYFSNFINSDMNPEDARSMCCRLRLDQKALRKRGGGLFGANPQTGSIGVVTINLARIGFTTSTEEEFLVQLDELMDLAKMSLEIKRKSIEEFTLQGLYPYSQFYLANIHERFGEYWKNHFSTIGILGMNEAIANLFSGENISTTAGNAFAVRVLSHMREKLEAYQEETNNIYNLEATPGESTTFRFAKMDKQRFGDAIKVANEQVVQTQGAAPYYTNSTQLPVGFTTDIFEALELQDELQTQYTGGTVLHGFIGEKIKPEETKKLVKKIAENFHLPYFTITPTFSICPKHGYMAGEHEYCPKCDADIAYATKLLKETKKQEA